MKWTTSWGFIILIGLFLLAPLGARADSCGEDYACREAMVKFSKHASEAHVDAVLQDAGATVVKYYPRTRLYHLLLPAQPSTLEQIGQIAQQEFVLVAEPNYVVHADLLPNDPSFSQLWGLHNTGQLGGTLGLDIGMEEVWDLGTDGSSVIVAVIDSGIDYDHPDLQANMWVNPGEIPGNGIDDDNNGFIDDIHGWDFRNDDADPMDDDSHGTHVAGTIGAVGNNGEGVVGVQWNAKLMACKFLNSSGNGLISDGVSCIEYALDNGATVLNNSWTSGSTVSLTLAVLQTDNDGAVLTAAAGNSSNDNDSFPSYPASYSLDNILAVASITRFDELSDFSNYGLTTVDLGAPGSSVYSTFPTWWSPGNNDYGFLSGTSMATPHVSGAAALLWAMNPGLTHRQVVNLLLLGVTPKAYLTGITVTGGVLNLPNSLDLVQAETNHAPIANAGPDQTGDLGETVTLDGSATDEDGDTPLVFEWTLQTPGGSSAQLDFPDDPNATFVPDVYGTYVASLRVSDAFATSLPDIMEVTVEEEIFPPPNVKIVATNLTQNQVLTGEMSVAVGDEVEMDGSETTGPFPDDHLYEWTLLAKPDGSNATLQNADEVTSSFTTDLPGTYTLRLNVEDGKNESFGEVSIVAVAKLVQVPDATEEESEAEAAGDDGSSSSATGGCSLKPKLFHPVTTMGWLLLFLCPLGFSVRYGPQDRTRP